MCTCGFCECLYVRHSWIGCPPVMCMIPKKRGVSLQSVKIRLVRNFDASHSVTCGFVEDKRARHVCTTVANCTSSYPIAQFSPVAVEHLQEECQSRYVVFALEYLSYQLFSLRSIRTIRRDGWAPTSTKMHPQAMSS